MLCLCCILSLFELNHCLLFFVTVCLWVYCDYYFSWEQLAPNWMFDSSTDRALHWYHKGLDSNPIQPWIFFRPSLFEVLKSLQKLQWSHQPCTPLGHSSSIWTSLILSIDFSAYFNWLCYRFATVVLSIFINDWLVLCKTAI